MNRTCQWLGHSWHHGRVVGTLDTLKKVEVEYECRRCGHAEIRLSDGEMPKGPFPTTGDLLWFVLWGKPK